MCIIEDYASKVFKDNMTKRHHEHLKRKNDEHSNKVSSVVDRVKADPTLLYGAFGGSYQRVLGSVKLGLPAVLSSSAAGYIIQSTQN